MFFNKLNLTILGLGLALAPLVPGYAHAVEMRTVAVFQQDDGTPCRIVAVGRNKAVECHRNGRWQSRPTATRSTAPAQTTVAPPKSTSEHAEAEVAARRAAATAHAVQFALVFSDI